MGFDAASVLALNPNIVDHHGVGYGVDGPMSAARRTPPPSPPRRGSPGHVLSDSLVRYGGAADPPVPDAEQLGFSALYRLNRASDGWTVLCAPTQAEWTALVRELPGELALADDERFATVSARRDHDGELAEILAGAFLTRTASEWEHTLSAVDVGCAEVAPMQGGLAMGLFVRGGVCDQLGMLTTVQHPIFDEHVRSRELVRLSRGTATLGPGCLIGEHTDEVLRDLGYDDAQIKELRAKGVVGG